MTDNNHQITPPPELVKQWDRESVTAPMAEQSYIATQAARWGADQELEACCNAFEDLWDQEIFLTLDNVLRGIRAARRPNDPIVLRICRSPK